MVDPATKCCGGKLSFLSPWPRLCSGYGPARAGYASISLLVSVLLECFPSPQQAQHPSATVFLLADRLTSERELAPGINGRSGQPAPHQIFDVTWQRSSAGRLKKCDLPALRVLETGRNFKPA